MQSIRPTPRNFHRRHGFILWERWVIANVIAEIFNFTLIAIVNNAVTMFEDVNGNEILIVIGLIRGIVLGVAQYFVLRPYIPNFIYWLIATTVGAFIGWIFLLVVSVITALELALTTEVLPTSLLFLRLLWLGATMGTVMGLAQGLAIKKCLRLGIKEVVLLINGNAFAYAVSLFLGFKTIAKVSFFNLAIAGATMGIVNGIITGLVLIHLVNLSPRRYNFYRNGW
ncbi:MULTISPECIES: hypothetical protein [unclassified Tolypothrix]|uniref:hypothetical protein n=1 Tax=unclassified Tolypothrix TaxID=2649714 RepID=UPI0005F76BBF|nr:MULTISPECIES: hypothetical protein [unclassified Tolypothrix]MBE9080766.1 hypothetical protein [Tolypothrix sp. LEGE 11397]UYD29629.1 hypothetical protein HGR01_17365 [Tolypothrix sp. PCC 7712]UYD34456.1 hypothetical protein HG267_00915 [Tolypothrix sp. PCC 7601]BAY88997.1 hypothetical protein NIES3275_09990 [Microchaete diplosiphon NIES-3275]